MDTGRIYSKFFPHLSHSPVSGCMSLANFCNNPSSQFCHSICASPRLIVALLCIAVFSILFSTSKPQMSGIYAKRLIAFVTNTQMSWDFSNVYSVRKSVWRLCSVTEAKSAITASVSASGPYPA